MFCINIQFLSSHLLLLIMHLNLPMKIGMVLSINKQVILPFINSEILMKQNYINHTSSLWFDIMLMLLAGVAGSIDVMSYFKIDHVFTANMTGNTCNYLV